MVLPRCTLGHGLRHGSETQILGPALHGPNGGNGFTFSRPGPGQIYSSPGRILLGKEKLFSCRIFPKCPIRKFQACSGAKTGP